MSVILALGKWSEVQGKPRLLESLKRRKRGREEKKPIFAKSIFIGKIGVTQW